MRVLVLHSDVAEDAPPDEQDTLATAAAVASGLEAREHDVRLHAFVPDPQRLNLGLRESRAEVVFNLVESIFGQGDLAGIAAAMLARQRVPFTGASAAALACAADKCFAKKHLRAVGLPTPDWSEGPQWSGLSSDLHYVIKSIDEDASVGLDDGAVVRGRESVHARAMACAKKHGGRWFAEVYCAGREFNVAVLEKEGEPFTLPIGETGFEGWTPGRPRIVNYAAKWHSDSVDCIGTPRIFGIEQEAPALAECLSRLAISAWRAMNLRGYGRVDFRLDESGAAMILEVNPNPCLEPQAGFAAAAARAGMDYPQLVDWIIQEALRSGS